ncbi:MAG: glycosyltransferase family 9 protein [Bdellovibrionales bacterium]
MRILLIQLARLGDIYITWPIVRALARKYPEAKIDLVVRKRFAEACAGLESIHELHILETDKILGPLLVDDLGLEAVNASNREFSSFADRLSRNAYDQVINLSFSPFSSYLTSLVTGEKTSVSGYTRYQDGSFCVADPVSQYFYSQIGVGSYNRIHLVELFSMIAGVVVAPEDWRAPDYLPAKETQPNIVIHVGASQNDKMVHRDSWVKIIHALSQNRKYKILLVGAKAEAKIASSIVEMLSQGNIENLVGKTSLKELFQIIQSAQLVIGGDSSPIHVAPLTETPCLNISFSSVNFWETGPRSAKSRVLYFHTPHELDTTAVVEESFSLLNDEEPRQASVRSSDASSFYEVLRDADHEFEWSLLLALYFGSSFPSSPDALFVNSLIRLQEVSQVVQQQLDILERNPAQKTALGIIERLDEVTEKIGELVPSARILTRWLMGHKINIPPGSLNDIINQTRQLYAKLDQVISNYTSVARETPKNI